MTKAREHERKVNEAITEINLAKQAAKKVTQRITELKGVFESINTRAVQSLNELESQPFDSKRDADKLQLLQVGTLMKSLIEILKTPVLNSDGQLNLGTVTVIEKYRFLPGK